MSWLTNETQRISPTNCGYQTEQKSKIEKLSMKKISSIFIYLQLDEVQGKCEEVDWQKRNKEHDADRNQHVVCSLHPGNPSDPAHPRQVLQVGVGSQVLPDLGVEDDDPQQRKNKLDDGSEAIVDQVDIIRPVLYKVPFKICLLGFRRKNFIHQESSRPFTSKQNRTVSFLWSLLQSSMTSFVIVILGTAVMLDIINIASDSENATETEIWT